MVATRAVTGKQSCEILSVEETLLLEVPDTCDLLVVLQGRALLNAVGNLELKDEYTEALHKLGHDLEAVAEQVDTHPCITSSYLL